MMSDNIEPTKPSTGHPWFLYLFLAIFVGVGIGCLLYAPVTASRSMSLLRNGVTTTGAVIDIQANRGSRSTTYAPVVSFITREGNRHQFRSQISKGTADYFVGQQVPVSYDPANPDDAEIRAFVPLWMPVIILLALGSAFTAFGAGGIYAARRSVQTFRRLEAARQRGLKEWEADPEWKTGAIRSITSREAGFFSIFAIVWNAIAQPTGYLVVEEVLSKGNYWAVIGLLFPAVGFWLLWMAISKTLQVRTFGDICLQMEPFPAAIGGEIGGTIELPRPYDSSNIFTITLICEQVIRSHDGIRHELVWQDDGQCVAAPGQAGTQVIFRMAVPAAGTPSGEDYRWSARLTAELPGIDLDRTFVIPVVVDEAPRRSRLDVPLATELKRRVPPPATTVRIAREADSLRFHYPCRRNLKSGLLVMFFSAWFLFFTALIAVKAPIAAFVFLPVFGLIGGALLLYAIWELGNALTVTLDGTHLTTARRLFGLQVKVMAIPLDQVKSVDVKHFGTRGTGASARMIFTVRAVRADGSRMTIGDGIEGRTVAEEVARRFRSACGMSTTGPGVPGREACSEEASSPPDKGSMTCPNCGTVQPPAKTCCRCQWTVSRDQERRDLSQAPPSRPADAARVIVALIVAAAVCLALAGGIFAWRLLQSPPSASLDRASSATTTSFRTSRFGFSLKVPAGWKVLTVEEAIQCATIRREYADQYLFMATPTTPDDALLVVDIAGVDLESFRSMGWDGYVDVIGGQNQLRRNEVTPINGITAHRIGYEVAGKYREDILFEAGGTLMEIYFYVPLAADTADQAARFRGIIEQELHRL